jgi:pyruvate dehydrogenase E2 component (dihydrolipoamide acetyltransferase)
MLAFLIKACVAALKQFPNFNSSLDGEQLVLKQYFHIGFAADTPHGLMVPVIKDADQKGIMQISQEMSELAKKARDGKLSPAELHGAERLQHLGRVGQRHERDLEGARGARNEPVPRVRRGRGGDDREAGEESAHPRRG